MRLCKHGKSALLLRSNMIKPIPRYLQLGSNGNVLSYPLNMILVMSQQLIQINIELNKAKHSISIWGFPSHQIFILWCNVDLSRYFPMSLIIYQAIIKKIRTVKEVWIPSLNWNRFDREDIKHPTPDSACWHFFCNPVQIMQWFICGVARRTGGLARSRAFRTR